MTVMEYNYCNHTGNVSDNNEQMTKLNLRSVLYPRDWSTNHCPIKVHLQATTTLFVNW